MERIRFDVYEQVSIESWVMLLQATLLKQYDNPWWRWRNRDKWVTR